MMVYVVSFNPDGEASDIVGAFASLQDAKTSVDGACDKRFKWTSDGGMWWARGDHTITKVPLEGWPLP